MLLFKYLSPLGIQKVLENQNQIALRFGLPKMYNDPYELFLQTDQVFKSKKIQAFYDFFLGDIIQTPVTCFSHCPDSVVMWAHYGHEGSGVCLGFDEDSLTNQFSIAYIDDVTYSSEPATIEYSTLERAFTTGKRRHTLLLLAEAQRAAYFVKREDWRYEKERRLVVLREDVNDENNLLISNVEPKVLRYIILGENTESAIKELCQSRAEQHNIPLMYFKVGKRSYKPFFIDLNSKSVKWNGNTFEICQKVCKKCHEPTTSLRSGICQWCAITDEMRDDVSWRSLFKATLFFCVEEGVPFSFAGLSPKGHSIKD